MRNDEYAVVRKVSEFWNAPNNDIWPEGIPQQFMTLMDDLSRVAAASPDSEPRAPEAKPVPPQNHEVRVGMRKKVPVQWNHCQSCDRPEVCDIILRGSAPCGMNAGCSDELAKEILRLRSELSAAQENHATVASSYNAACEENEELRAQVASLSKDRDRLDWLEGMSNCVVTIDGRDHYLGDTKTTIRSAIDQAMQVSGGSEKETEE